MRRRQCRRRGRRYCGECPRCRGYGEPECSTDPDANRQPDRTLAQAGVNPLRKWVERWHIRATGPQTAGLYGWLSYSPPRRMSDRPAAISSAK